MTKKEALMMAIEALDNADYHRADEAIVIIKEALAQPEQKPIGTVKELFTQAAWERLDLKGSTDVYITSPQHTWVGLTDEDELDWDGGDLKSLVKAIEAKLKEKNNA